MLGRWLEVTVLAAVLGLWGCIPAGGGGGGGDDDDSGPGDVDLGEDGMGGEGGEGGMGGMGGEGGAGGMDGGCMPEGGIEQRPCGLEDSGLETRTCQGGAWSAWGACEGAAACADGEEETEACGEMGNGTRTRACVGGQWAAFGPCDDPDRACEEGETEEVPCGLNGRGTQSHTCEDGRFGPFDDCVDPDACVDEASERAPCGLNGRGGQTRTCVDGQWGEPGECVDPDVCTDGARESQPCGLNDRGEQTRRCAEGRWSDFEVCDDPDACVDGAEEATPCGINGRGEAVRVCVDGQYGEPACNDPDACVDGADEERACGLNGRGLEARRCAEGAWDPWGMCADPDRCIDGEDEARACGPNGLGLEFRTCVAGQFGPYGPCEGGGMCLEGTRESRDCGLNGRGEESRQCVDGIWSPYGACDDPDVCVDGEDESRACGLNDRGREFRLCRNGQWGPFDICEDIDECVDGEVEREPCIQGGTRSRTCVEGRFEPFGQCIADEATPIADPGGSIRLEGQLTAADDTWNRPTAGCGAAHEPGFRYDAFTVVNRTGAAQTLTVLATWGQGDGYLHVFDGRFDPARPVADCIIGNDDFDGTDQSRIEQVPIADGEAVIIVASSYSAGAAIGPYTIDVTTDAEGEGPQPGDLVITEIMYNPSAVADRNGEWFEVYNTSGRALQLSGVVVGDLAGGRSAIDRNLLVPVGGYAVLGTSVELATNGGIRVDATFGPFLLDNAGETLILINRDGAELDRVAYDPASGWPDEPGRSIQLDRGVEDPLLNDDVQRWCLATARLPSGDFGTPGAVNSACN